MDRERLKRIRNFQSTDWYAALVMRPLSILVMLVIADWRWLTPNRLTHMGNVTKLASAMFIFLDEPTYMIAGVILLQLGVLFDHLDGTVARYRRQWSNFGSYYDKASDALTWFVIMLAIGWVAYRRSSDPIMLVLATTSAYAFLSLGYMKWVAHAEEQRLEWHLASEDAAPLIAKNTRPPKLSEPPERTLKDWIKWFLWSMAQIVRFEEIDLFFWVGLALLIDQLELLLWVLAITQSLGALIMLVKRGLDMRRVDREMRRFRAGSADPPGKHAS
jgi:phosphatidylglycerophosphate synthase